MNHSKMAAGLHSLQSKARRIMVILFPVYMAMASCQKEQISDQSRNQQPKAKVNRDNVLDSVIVHGTVIKLKLQYEGGQLTRSFHYHNDGQLKKQATYQTIRHDLRGKILRITVKNDGTYDYEYDGLGRIVSGRYYPESSGTLVPAKRMEYEYGTDTDGNDFLLWQRSYGGGGLDVLIATTGYDRNPNGTIKSIQVYEGKDMQLKGKVILENNATPEQLAAWRMIAQKFPEPEIPWQILTMLYTRIEMHGGGTVADDVIVDGSIITAENMVFNGERLSGLTYSGESGGMNEAISFHYSMAKK